MTPSISAACYGSVSAFADQLSQRGLQLASGFFAELGATGDFNEPAFQLPIIQRAEQYSEFIKACGGDVMVIGAPLRQTPGSEPTQFFDLERAQKIASFFNRLGAVVAKCGIKLAVHTEAHSMFAMSRDTDLLMLLTDPVYVHFCPDTAHLVLAGANPLDVVKRHHERMVIAHWKDAIGAMPADTPIDETIHDRHQPFFCGLGTGRVDWDGWVRLLREIQYEGWAILELDAAADPVSEIAAGFEYVTGKLLPTYS